jgi:hypothetical protein
MRRFILPVLAVSTLSLLVAVPASSAGISKSEVQSKSLALSDMPTGWSVDHSTSGALSNPGGCLSALEALKKPAKGTVRAHVQYDDQEVPAVQETLEAGKGAIARYDKYLKTLNGCTSVSFSDSGQTITGTVGAMSFPTVGNSSSAYAMNFTIEGESVGLDVVFFRVGQYDGDLEYVDYSPDTSTMQAFAQEAAAKVEGKPTTPPTTF